MDVEVLIIPKFQNGRLLTVACVGNPVTRAHHRTGGRVHPGHGCAPGRWTAVIMGGQVAGLERGRHGTVTGEGRADTPHFGTNDRGALAVKYKFPVGRPRDLRNNQLKFKIA
jgi:hypothetical protein